MNGTAGWIFGGGCVFFALYPIIAAFVVHLQYRKRYEEAGLPWVWWRFM